MIHFEMIKMAYGGHTGVQNSSTVGAELGVIPPPTSRTGCSLSYSRSRFGLLNSPVRL